MRVAFLAVTNPVYVSPYITYQGSEGMPLVALTAVIFVELATFSAPGVWGPDFMELESSG